MFDRNAHYRKNVQMVNSQMTSQNLIGKSSGTNNHIFSLVITCQCYKTVLWTVTFEKTTLLFLGYIFEINLNLIINMVFVTLRWFFLYLLSEDFLYTGLTSESFKVHGN